MTWPNRTGLSECNVDPQDPSRITDRTRTLGLVVCRSTAIILICPEDGLEEIANPFLGDEEGAGE